MALAAREPQPHGKGTKDGTEAIVTIDLVDYFDLETGFTAMERLAGWHCVIMMGFQACDVIQTGGVPMEITKSPADLMAEIVKRDIQFNIRWD